jgi:uncharacterized protein
MIYPSGLSILMSEDCNLACDYCFELGHHKNKKADNETIKRSVDFIFNNAVLSKSNEASIMLFGGEPLLNEDGIEYIFNYSMEKKKQYPDVNYYISMVTNGTIMNDHIKSLFKDFKDDLKLNVQISIDGIKQFHDNHRVYKNSRIGSFDKVKENFKIWRYEIFPENNGRLHIHGCLTPENMHSLYTNWQYFYNEWNMPYQWYMPIHGTDYSFEDTKMYKRELLKIAKTLVDIALKTRDLKHIEVLSPLDKCLCDRNGFSRPCGAGNTFVTVTANGKIFPCHQIYYNDPDECTQIGDLYSNPIINQSKVKLYEYFTNDDMSCREENPNCNCYDCYRCLADNYRKYGNLFTQIRGPRCMMSHIERDVYKYMQTKLREGGLI